jgi:GH15 family glucan-1,4-alpha-glucosidase
MRYPPISDYGLIGDCHSAALISKSGSIDWCCLPQFDSDSCFGRLLDWDRGGHFTIAPEERFEVRRAYADNSLVLVTTFSSPEGEARLVDFFAMRGGGRVNPRREIVRIIEGVRGVMRLDVHFCARFDFGEVKPWVFDRSDGTHAAVGSNKALLIFGDLALERDGEHDLRADLTIRAGERRHVAVQYVAPESAWNARAVR